MATRIENDASSDLDITAELPQLNVVSAPVASTIDSTAEFDPQQVNTATLHIDAGNHWDLMDELISVRDKIVGLETSLADAEGRLTKLQTRHDSLQVQHADLLTHGQEVSRDRDRLTEERLLWLAAKQQLQDQLETQRVEANASLLSLQQDLQQQQHNGNELQRQLAAQQAELGSARQQYAQQVESLSQTLQEERQRVETLSADLQMARREHDQQYASAAALARSMAQEVVEKTELQQQLSARAARIAVLELRLNEAQGQLVTAAADNEALSQNLARHQQQIEAQGRQTEELQRTLAAANERIDRLMVQVETENGHWRSAEQDKERLQQLANAEREGLERSRRELSERQAEISSLQERLSRAGVDNDQLNQQLVERTGELRAQEHLLAAGDRELQVLRDHQTAAAQREAALNDALAVLREELTQAQGALQERAELHAASVQSLESERRRVVRAEVEHEALRSQLEQVRGQLQERDKFILSQAHELDEAQRGFSELADQLKRRDQTVAVQAERIAELGGTLQRLQAEHAQRSTQVAQLQQELESRNQEQGVSARQVEALQAELHQHVEAMNAIRRDIHQVAMQTRDRVSENQVRTLTRLDDASVVHLLNKNSMSVGRGHDCDLRIQSDSVSRHHACLRVSRDAVIIEDMGSTNGCYVNGRRIKRQLLKDGDKVEIGAVAMRFATRVAGQN